MPNRPFGSVDKLKTCLCSAIREAWHNCAPHSQASTVKVVVRQEPSRIVVSVEDDGRGFDARRLCGLGPVDTEERILHLGGAFKVKSRPGAAIRVAVELPVAS